MPIILRLCLLSLMGCYVFSADSKVEQSKTTATDRSSEAASQAPLDQSEQAKENLRKEMRELISRLEQHNAAIDELNESIDDAKGEEQAALQEAAWGRYQERFGTLLALKSNLLKQREAGIDTDSAFRKLIDVIEDQTRSLRKHLARLLKSIERAYRKIENSSIEERLNVERTITTLESKGLRTYRSWLTLLLALGELGADIQEERAEAVARIVKRGETVSARLVATKKKRAQNTEALERDPDKIDLSTWRDIYDEQFDRECHNLSECIAMLTMLGEDATEFQKSMVKATGEISEHLFSWRVLSGLVGDWWQSLVRTIKEDGPAWLAKAVVFFAILIGFKIIAFLVRLVVRRAVRAPNLGFSQLLQHVILSVLSRSIMIIGIFVGLAQIGVPIGHLLAGLGIAGFIIGFALQDVLANFAAGTMILFTRPYDVDDVIEVTGIRGRVNSMNVVSTTILTGDNQTFIVPNAKIWGDVIRNITANDLRRVDLVFNVAFGSDFHKVEEVCQEQVSKIEGILDEPEPTIRIQGITPYSVQVIVRPWVKREDYWTVNSQLTKSVTIALHEAGIEIPKQVLGASPASA